MSDYVAVPSVDNDLAPETCPRKWHTPPWQVALARATLAGCTTIVVVGLLETLVYFAGAPRIEFYEAGAMMMPSRVTMGRATHPILVPHAARTGLPGAPEENPIAVASELPGSLERYNWPTTSILPLAAGSFVFAVFFMSFLQEKLKEINQPVEKPPPPDPATVMQTLERRLISVLRANASPEMQEGSVKLVSGACGMRQLGKAGKGSKQVWRGPEYCDMDCGEDSFVLTDDHIGVSDGVGAWREEGVDPSVFANQLMHNAKDIVMGRVQPVAEPDGAGPFSRHPALVMHRAFAKMILNNEVRQGSATCCLAWLSPSGVLHVTNLGDSCLLVIRNGGCVFRARTNQYSFNSPYQLEVPFKPGNTMVTEAAIQRFQAQPGDGIVVASDGLFDNMFDIDVAEIVEAHKKKSPRALAEILKNKALEVSNNKTKDTPFSEVCGKCGYKWAGGKQDDITVVVAWVRAA